MDLRRLGVKVTHWSLCLVRKSFEKYLKINAAVSNIPYFSVLNFIFHAFVSQLL